MKLIRSTATALLLLTFLAGCASTPDKRIQKNQTLFDSFPVATQARIRGGKIDLGFTEDMVRIGLGEPQRKMTRRTAQEQRNIWLYIETVQRYERQHADIDGINMYGSKGSSIGGSAWINVLQEKEYLKTRVEFLNGRVIAIEEAAKDKPSP